MGFFTRSKITAQTGMNHPIPLNLWTSDGSNAITLTTGFWGSGTSMIESAAASNNQKAVIGRHNVRLPIEHCAAGDASASLVFKVWARFSGAPNVGGNIDLEAKLSDEQNGVGSDLCSTAAQNLSTGWTLYSFTINPAAMGPGSDLSLCFRGFIDDTGGATSTKVQIGATYLEFTGRG